MHYKCSIVTLIITFISPAITAAPCTEVSCLSVKLIKPDQLQKNGVVAYTTREYGDTYLEQTVLNFSEQPNAEYGHHIDFKQSELAQPNPVIGFGGAFTDSSAMLFHSLPASLQEKVIQAYFSINGIGYSLGRVPMASTDFSCRSAQGKPSLNECHSALSQYSYDDYLNDFSLDKFALQPEDVDFKIPFINRAIKASAKNQIDLKLYASPWSAPAWMKRNGSAVRGSLIDSPRIKTAWANYFVNFFKAYKSHGIHFWGLTVQNEPVEGGLAGTSQQWWQTMFSTTEESADFIANYLGPTLANNSETANLKIMMHDDQVTTLSNRIKMLENPDVSKYISGIGVHWYLNYDWSYTTLSSAFLKINPRLPNASPQSNNTKFMLGTEACAGYTPCIFCGPNLNDWSRGEAYAHDIIQDLNNYISGWTDWNLLLDVNGGPNWAKNYVDSPMIVDIEKTKVYLEPMFFYMGHFSRFIRPGSHRLQSTSYTWPELEEVAYSVPAHHNLPATIVVVVLNRNFIGQRFYIHDKTKNRYINNYIPPHSIQTYVYQADETANGS